MDAQEIQKHFDRIDQMGQFEMAKLWRFAPSGHIYFDINLPFHERFSTRFKKMGGMTPTISKQIG